MHVRLGIIGLGHMGGYHASVASVAPHIDLIAVADTDPKNIAKITSSKVIKSDSYRDWIDLVDAVIIAVPTFLHHPIALDCLTRGKHVLIEKPITHTLEHAIELFNVATKNKLALHVGHVERFNGAVQELKKVIDAPYLVESHRMGPFSSRVAHDTVILDLMIHDLDIILNLVGSPVKNVNLMGKSVHSPLCDIAVAQIEFVNGALANIISSRASQIKKRVMSVHQKNAFIELDFTTQDIAIHRHASSSVLSSPEELRYRQESTIERLFVYKENPLKREIDYFISAIRSNEHLMQPDQDIEALKLTLSLEKALKLSEIPKKPDMQPAAGI